MRSVGVNDAKSGVVLLRFPYSSSLFSYSKQKLRLRVTEGVFFVVEGSSRVSARSLDDDDDDPDLEIADGDLAIPDSFVVTLEVLPISKVTTESERSPRPLLPCLSSCNRVMGAGDSNGGILYIRLLLVLGVSGVLLEPKPPTLMFGTRGRDDAGVELLFDDAATIDANAANWVSNCKTRSSSDMASSLTGGG